jgi:hypothetical protein
MGEAAEATIYKPYKAPYKFRYSKYKTISRKTYHTVLELLAIDPMIQ